MSSTLTSSPSPLPMRAAYIAPRPDRGRNKDPSAYTKSHPPQYAISMRIDRSTSMTASKNINRA